MVAVAERISPQEYLELERKSEVRHEYIDGRMVEKIGDSLRHNTITGNLAFTIGTYLRKRSGNVYISAMRIRATATNCYFYPDVLATSGKPELEEDELDVLLDPAVIFEVLSIDSEHFDRGEKFENYRTIESLQEYLMVSQETHHIEHYIRQPDGQWLFSEAMHIGETINLPTIGCDLPLEEVYDGVEIDAEAGALNGQAT